MVQPTTWAGEVELKALSELFELRIVVVSLLQNDVVVGAGSNVVMLAFANGNHYDLLLTREKLVAHALAQVCAVLLARFSDR